MTNVFEGEPDGGQSADTEMPTSRFRPKYRALADEEKVLHDAIKDAATGLEILFGAVADVRKRRGHAPTPREAALAMTKLEEAVMWAVKGLTA